MKILVGGYYDDRIFKGEEFLGKTRFSKDIEVYTVDEALKLDFVSGVEENYNENHSKDWDSLDYRQKAIEIESYMRDDEIAGMKCFETRKDALDFKNETLKEIEEIEKKILNKEIQCVERKNNVSYELYIYERTR